MKNETVDEGKIGGYADALKIEGNIVKRKLTVAGAGGTRVANQLIEPLNLLGGEAESLGLFKRGGDAAIASDDRKFVDLLESLSIAYMTPGALLINLLRRKRISESETLQYLEKIRPLISSEEYLVSIEALRRNI